VKKTWVILAGVAALVVGVYCTSHTLAQAQQQPTGQAAASGPRTRIALINLAAVIRNYNKYKNATANMKRELEGVQETLKTKRKAITDKQAIAQQPNLSPEQKEQLARELRSMERDFDDASADFKQRFQKEDMEVLVQVYQEVKDVVLRYAANYDIDLVMQYSDVPPEEANTPAAIGLRIRTNACLPMCAAAGMDITTAITNILNQNLAANPAAQNGAVQPAGYQQQH